MRLFPEGSQKICKRDHLCMSPSLVSTQSFFFYHINIERMISERVEKKKLTVWVTSFVGDEVMSESRLYVLFWSSSCWCRGSFLDMDMMCKPKQSCSMFCSTIHLLISNQAQFDLLWCLHYGQQFLFVHAIFLLLWTQTVLDELGATCINIKALQQIRVGKGKIASNSCLFSIECCWLTVSQCHNFILVLLALGNLVCPHTPTEVGKWHNHSQHLAQISMCTEPCQEIYGAVWHHVTVFRWELPVPFLWLWFYTIFRYDVS